jgi:hypothetical protein
MTIGPYTDPSCHSKSLSKSVFRSAIPAGCHVVAWLVMLLVDSVLVLVLVVSVVLEVESVLEVLLATSSRAVTMPPVVSLVSV